MVTIQFYPIDIEYIVEDDNPVIVLWGKQDNGERLGVHVNSDNPYFYVKTKRRDLLEISKNMNDREIKPLAIEKVERKHNNKMISLFKVSVKIPADVPILRDAYKEIDGIDKVYEADILYTRRFLIDNSISPLMKTTADGEFIDAKSKVPIFKANKIRQDSDEGLEEFNIAAVDIETYSPAGQGVDFDTYPIIMIAVYYKDVKGKKVKKVITWKRFKTNNDFIEFVSSEAEMINRFYELIDEIKPDVITGYFSDGFDLPYIKKRTLKLRLDGKIGLDGSQIRLGRGRDSSSYISGICHIDVLSFIRNVISKTMNFDSLKLDDVGKALIGMGKTEGVKIEELAGHWDNGSDVLSEYAVYNLRDAEVTFKLLEKLLPNLIEFVKIVELPFFDIIHLSFSQLVEWYLIREAFSRTILIPNRPDKDSLSDRRRTSFTGAFVLEPKPGFYRDIVIYDFRSIYPSIITSHNISPDTVCCSCCKDKSEKVPGEDIWICKNVRGFVADVIENLVMRRSKVKKILKGINDKSKKVGKTEAIMLNAKSQSLKILANSMYGYFAFMGARWYSIEAAKSTTAWGRFHIKDVINKSNENGYPVLYSDTDSIMVSLGKNSRESLENFISKINHDLPGSIELEFDGYFTAGIFVSAKSGSHGAKKKYAMLTEDKSLRIKGFETIRRNWSLIGKEVQNNVLHKVLEQGNAIKALDYVKKIVSDVKNHKISSDKMIISTKLQKALDNYDTIGPHVAAARLMQDKGIFVGPGSIIKYVITAGDDRIRDRVKLPEDCKDNEYDSDYYINNQIIPTVERILNVFDMDKDDILSRSKQQTLGSY
ncbi:DNA-directed DNA polymerase [Candidatus Woesearchaeota archaeon]|nr:DNA-directed DNA polymerase [Candidatus Woesearchaeota archaeon]